MSGELRLQDAAIAGVAVLTVTNATDATLGAVELTLVLVEKVTDGAMVLRKGNATILTFASRLEQQLFKIKVRLLTF